MGEIGLNQINEFHRRLRQHWPSLDEEKCYKFIEGLTKAELNELWWLYKQAFYSSIYKKPSVEAFDKLKKVLVRNLIITRNE